MKEIFVDWNPKEDASDLFKYKIKVSLENHGTQEKRIRLTYQTQYKETIVDREKFNIPEDTLDDVIKALQSFQALLNVT